MADVKSKSVSQSQVTLTELMIPSYANFGGKIHGGIILSLMDKVAYACASKHAGTYCVTVSVDGVDFHSPTEVGELVSLHASVNYVGRTSLVVGIKVQSENVKTGEIKHTNSSFFTMVAKGDDDQPVEVPRLILESIDDVRRFVNVVKRRNLKGKFSEQVEISRENFAFNEDLNLLKEQRCEVLLS
ncbi:MAG: acyl-CoA thioesterase [Reichenbachiella sp.]|uniref:acyl-CoA thioesterase n=1 Tax=Reichenbachiella sp. TaxID=2184521 RepID=UPI003266D6D2